MPQRTSGSAASERSRDFRPGAGRWHGEGLVFDEFRHVATTSTLLLAHGLIEREGEVVYMQRLEKLVLREFGTTIDRVSMSRDFH
jgi:hypothetical protein